MTIFIDTDEGLREHCERWLQGPAVGIDTEFERSRTYYARAALIQVNDGSNPYLIDPLRITDFKPLAALLESPTVIKVLHAAGEDLPLLAQLAECEPRCLFDTQIAAPFLAHDYSPSYHALVGTVLETTLAKSETRSDWMQRPLTEAQLVYAAQDVDFLLPLHRIFVEKLRDMQREQWVEEDVERFRVQKLTPVAAKDAYLRFGASRDLNQRELGILQDVCAWREIEAERRDLPRRFVLEDESALSLAKRQPENTTELGQVERLSRRGIERDGDTLLALVGDALQRKETDLPPLRTPSQVLRAQTDEVKTLQSIVREHAQQLDVPPQLLANRKVLAALVKQQHLDGPAVMPEVLKGWRYEVITEHLLRALRG